MESEAKRPKVGLGVLVVRDGKVLLGQRINTHGANTWQFPGGHMEFGESFEQTARRECMEEAGITLGPVSFLHTTNDIFEEEGKHYVTVIMQSTTTDDPKVLEPEKCASWGWYDWNHLPQPLMKPIVHLLEDGVNPQL